MAGPRTSWAIIDRLAKSDPGAFEWQLNLSVAYSKLGDVFTKQSNREGMIDSLTYFLAYFYPRIAVLDDYNVWDRMNFMDSHEFYSDFNDYIVTINAPKNYVVWGTGTLQHPENVLQPEILKRFNESFTSNQVIHVATKEELAAGKVTTQNAMNSWQFTAKNIPDMTFGISDHYIWDAGSVVVDDATKRRASVQAAYLNAAADYRFMVKFGKHALDWLSHNWPGVPYPYQKTSIIQGFADMEYPMMVNDSHQANPAFARFVAEHEIAHTWYRRPQDLPGDVDPGGLEATCGYKPQRDSGTFSYAAHAVTVAVDPELGDVEILDYVIVEDGGKLVNPMVVDGQIYGGLAQGIGTALYEEMPFDINGQPLATTFADYLLPGPTEVPEPRLDHIETLAPYTEFGVKGIGEGGAIAPPAAIANAVNDALKGLGAELLCSPITPRRVLESIAAAKLRRASAAVPAGARS